MSSLNNKFRKFAIPNLTFWLIVGYAIGYMIQMVDDSFLFHLALDPYMIITHPWQIYRIVSWVIIPPPSSNIILMLLVLYCCYTVGSILERTWGTYKYNQFIFTGIILTVIMAFAYFGLACIIDGYQGIKLYEEAFRESFDNAGLYMGSYKWYTFSTYYINVSIYLAFAMTYPDTIVRLYMLIPVKMKWLGIIDVVYLVILLIFGSFATRFAVVAALVNCLIFYLSNIKGKNLNPYQIHRQNQFKRKFNTGMANAGRTRNTGGVTSSTSNVKMNARPQTRHKCAICGKTEISDPDMEFRYCSKCAGSYEYCSVHLFTHTHVRG